VPVPEEEAPEPEPEPIQATVTFDGKTRTVTAPRAVLGRSRDCDVRVADSNISRRHAELRHEDEAWWIVDLGSTNGTLVNGRRTARERLRDGDRLTLGGTEIVFGDTRP
jgi:pSer/pThr/pTyr-binding forkhead associated (FHA) protein